MKLLIITSSIFYLLGLKLTNQVEIEKQATKDTVQIEVKTQNKIILPETKSPKIPEIELENKETPANCGSSMKTAPWIFQQDIQKLN